MEENKNNEQQKWAEILPVIIKNLIQNYQIIIIVGLAFAFLTDTYKTYRYVPQYSCQATLRLKPTPIPKMVTKIPVKLPMPLVI